jgi:hypothetical protein
MRARSSERGERQRNSHLVVSFQIRSMEAMFASVGAIMVVSTGRIRVCPFGLSASTPVRPADRGF